MWSRSSPRMSRAAKCHSSTAGDCRGFRAYSASRNQLRFAGSRLLQDSVQAAKVAPNDPRAIYFGDNVAVAFVPGSDEHRVGRYRSATGCRVYSLNVKPAEKPTFVRGTICVKCHQGPATSGVPGMFVGSVFPNALGNPAKEGAIITDHRTKFEDRWGGWYVNAKRGQQKDPRIR